MQKFYSHGFSIPTFMVYLLFFSLITLLVTNTISLFLVPTFSCIRKHRFFIEAHCATDLFVRDARKIPSAENIDLSTPSKIRWNYKTVSIKWCFNKNKIERTEKQHKNGQIIKKKSVVISGVINAIFTIEKLKRWTSVELLLIPEYDPSQIITSCCAIKTEPIL